MRQVVDLNFLFDVMVSRGHREILTIDFKKTFRYSIEAIKAADEESIIAKKVVSNNPNYLQALNGTKKELKNLKTFLNKYKKSSEIINKYLDNSEIIEFTEYTKYLYLSAYQKYNEGEIDDAKEILEQAFGSINEQNNKLKRLLVNLSLKLAINGK